jgi:formamidopyrimidine-DNA glycosylase
MPELPEVETVRRGLESRLVGRTIVAVAATGRRTVRRHDDPDDLARLVTGRNVARIDRHGKYLFLVLADATMIVVHLRMSGQLLVAGDRAEPLRPHTHVVFDLDDGHQLRFVDPRTFGEVFAVAPGTARGDIAGLALLGPDALEIDRRSLVAALRRRRVGVKTLLMDQRIVAGVGNIYSDEILHRARLRFDRRGVDLSAAAAGRVHHSMVEVLVEAVEHRGSSLADEQYVDVDGRPGTFQSLHRVHARAGQPCGACGRPVERARTGGRSTYFCRRCQR